MGGPRPYKITTKHPPRTRHNSYGWKCRLCGEVMRACWDYRYNALTSVRWHMAYSHIWNGNPPEGIPPENSGPYVKDSTWIRDIVEPQVK